MVTHSRAAHLRPCRGRRWRSSISPSAPTESASRGVRRSPTDLWSWACATGAAQAAPQSLLRPFLRLLLTRPHAVSAPAPTPHTTTASLRRDMPPTEFAFTGPTSERSRAPPARRRACPRSTRRQTQVRERVTRVSTRGLCISHRHWLPAGRNSVRLWGGRRLSRVRSRRANAPAGDRRGG